MKNITLKQLGRIIRESDDEVVFEDEDFVLRKVSGVGVNDTPWTGLNVESRGLAEKHCVEVRLQTKNYPIFDGKPVEYAYKFAYVAHGMRMKTDTLDETREYIAVLDEAVNFAERVNTYLQNGTVTEYEE